MGRNANLSESKVITYYQINKQLRNLFYEQITYFFCELCFRIVSISKMKNKAVVGSHLV